MTRPSTSSARRRSASADLVAVVASHQVAIDQLQAKVNDLYDKLSVQASGGGAQRRAEEMVKKSADRSANTAGMQPLPKLYKMLPDKLLSIARLHQLVEIGRIRCDQPYGNGTLIWISTEDFLREVRKVAARKGVVLALKELEGT